MRADKVEAGHQIHIGPTKRVTVKATKDDKGIRMLHLQADKGDPLWVIMRPDAEVLVARGRKVDVS